MSDILCKLDCDSGCIYNTNHLFYDPDLFVYIGYREMNKDDFIEVADKKEHNLCFLLSGEIKIDFNEFKGVVIGGGEMIFMPQSANCRGEAISDLKMITIAFNLPEDLSDEDALGCALSYCKSKVKYVFRGLPMCRPIKGFVETLATYISDNITCAYLNTLKIKELFMILRQYYEIEDLARFFYHSIGSRHECQMSGQVVN